MSLLPRPRMANSTALLLLLLLCLFTTVAGSSDIESDRAALLAFRGSFTGPRIHWNTTSSPCSWTGVGCYSGRVTSLRLPAARLVGEIPSGTIGNLTALRTLSLRLNDLYGPLPPDIAGAAKLRHIYLQGNFLSGEIPPAISDLRSLVKLDISSNFFTGRIPADFTNLSHLTILFLERNNLSGQIPDLDLPNLKLFNISYNQLTGSIPTRLRKWPSNAFLGMPHLCDGPLSACRREIPSSPSPSPSPSPWPAPVEFDCKGAIAGIAFIPFLFILIFALVTIHLTPWKKKLVFSSEHHGTFSIRELVWAESEVLGNGMYGLTYKVLLKKNQRLLTVKRLNGVVSPESEFRNRIQNCIAIHDNIVHLQAYYYSEEAGLVLLFYDYMLTSLFSVLHGGEESNIPGNCDRLYEIALASAKGIQDIHSRGTLSIHGNIKSSNILLAGPAFQIIRVSDHGLLGLLTTDSIPTRCAGYGAPELRDGGETSQETDVYSFGVLLLEMLTGRDPWQHLNGGVDVQSWVDDTLDTFQNGQKAGKIRLLLHVAMNCAAPVPEQRFTMSRAVTELENIQI